MGWFDEQIKQRIKNDDLSFSEAFTDMAEVVMNRKFSQSDKYDDTRMAKDAIEEILKYYPPAPAERCSKCGARMDGKADEK